MADFKISRLRYTWKGDWVTDTSYKIDDVVKFGPNSYVCVSAHTSSTFVIEINHWIKMTEGYRFRGIWESETDYVIGDVISYGATVYICNTSHTSGSTLEDDSSKWSIYFQNINWRDGWTAETYYTANDLVRYGAKIYRCVDAHTSILAGLEEDISKWEIYYTNNNWRGNYTAGSRYYQDDLVIYGGTLWRCLIGHTAPSEGEGILFDTSTTWTLEIPGNQFSGEWNSTVIYQRGDIVKHGGYIYVANINNLNQTPSNDIYQADEIEYWKLLSVGINFLGNWSVDSNYKTGDVVRRGGNLYLALLDTSITEDGSTLDYLDVSNWEILTESKNWQGRWAEGNFYQLNDLVIFDGTTYVCNFAHESDDQNYPGDNGNGIYYWDVLVQAGSEIGLKQAGDLLTYNLSRLPAGDGSTFGSTNVPIGNQGQYLTIDNDDNVVYNNFNILERVVYVGTDGIDDNTDPLRGYNPNAPWKSIRYACDQLNDEFTGHTTVRVSAGVHSEILPIIIPARTVILGTELRTTIVEPAEAIPELANDATYTIAALSRISQLIQSVINQETLSPPKTPSNLSDPVDLNLDVFETAGDQIQDMIQDMVSLIRYYVESLGSLPTGRGSNEATTDSGIINAILVLEANREFLKDEVIAFLNATYLSYDYDETLCRRDIDRYIDAFKYDLLYAGNYKSLVAARWYKSAVLGSASENMFLCRDATGVRNLTVRGLTGTLPTLPDEGNIYKVPTGGAYMSLDPGWGPNDEKVWITTRSPYIQGVTTFGTACVGQKIDGALHNGGNRSMVSNDFTQVLDDGIGAWVANGGRAELVSVFTYYGAIGYYATNGGIIRATNGNCSYGLYGAVADGNDSTEIPDIASVTTRELQAQVAAVFAGEFVDEIQTFEFTDAGQNYTSATADIFGAGVNASVLFEEFRDNAVFNIRLRDTSDTIGQVVGGAGYTLTRGNAQPHETLNGDLTSITLQSNDSNEEEDILGMRLVIISGSGTGQYGYISAYDSLTKVASIKRESDDQPGWDHLIGGREIKNPLDTTTTYSIEPRPIIDDPGFTVTNTTLGVSTDWGSIAWGEIQGSYTGLSGTVTSRVKTSNLASFDVEQNGRSFTVTLTNGGTGFVPLDTIVISGDDVGGATPENDILITVRSITNGGTILTFNQESIASSGKFVALTKAGSAGVYSKDGSSWTTFNMPVSGNWICLANGLNKFVAIAQNSDNFAYSTNGETWTGDVLPLSADWRGLTFGDGRFVAVSGDQNKFAYSDDGESWTADDMPSIGDSSFNEWVDVVYGKGKFVAISNSGNYAAVSEDGETWTANIMDVIGDSSQRDWVSIAYGNDRFVAISTQGDIAFSFDGAFWYPGTMPSQDGSTAHLWRKIKYGHGVFFAIGDTGARTVGAETTTGPSNYCATSPDGYNWTPRTLNASKLWTQLAFGNPSVYQYDSTVGISTPVWVALAQNDGTGNRIRTGKRALARVIVETGQITEVRIWDPGSGYLEEPNITFVGNNVTVEAEADCRIGDGVLSNPEWLDRGLGYRTNSTRVTIEGNGHSDLIPEGRFIYLTNLERYPATGTQITFPGNDQIYSISSITQLGGIDGDYTARLRVLPDLKVRDRIEHGTSATLRKQYSQIRMTGHDFLDIGTGNFLTTNYPEVYSGFVDSAPEQEVLEEQGGRVFYTATDQSGNFRTGELFAVEQATGIVTISADFFNLAGLSELRLGGIRIGGTNVVIREFSTDQFFTEDSNNIVPTQRAIAGYLNNRLTVGGSEIATASFVAGTVRVGPQFIGSTINGTVEFTNIVDFSGPGAGISGGMLAQTMFYRSFYS